MTPALTPEMLLKAYAAGVFPMAEARDDPELFWLAPKARCLLPLDAFHVPRRLARTIRQDRFHITVDEDFGAVIRACAEAGGRSSSTWISHVIVELYEGLYNLGHAHSVECRNADGALVGGLYGVSLGAAFFGESMFSGTRDASKVALVHLVARLRHGGYRLLDAQFMTEHLRQFGAIEIDRDAYHARLAEAVAATADFYSLPDSVSGRGILQLVTQTS